MSTPEIAEDLATLIRHHERVRQENAQMAGDHALKYVGTIGHVDGPSELARTEAMRLNGEATAAEIIIRDLRGLLDRITKPAA